MENCKRCGSKYIELVVSPPSQRLVDEPDFFYVLCQDCWHSGKSSRNPEEAIANWDKEDEKVYLEADGARANSCINCRDESELGFCHDGEDPEFKRVRIECTCGISGPYANSQREAIKAFNDTFS